MLSILIGGGRGESTEHSTCDKYFAYPLEFLNKFCIGSTYIYPKLPDFFIGINLTLLQSRLNAISYTATLQFYSV